MKEHRGTTEPCGWISHLSSSSEITPQVDAIPVAVKDPQVREAYNKRVMKAYIKYGILERAGHVKQAQN